MHRLSSYGFLILLFTNSSVAFAESFIWNQFRHSTKVTSQTVLESQIQVRYSLRENKLSEEQFNLNYSFNSSLGRLGALFTFGTENGFKRHRELRYALEYESPKVKIFKNINYSLRLRKELRDFMGIAKEASRFRLRSQVVRKIHKGHVFLSSEINIYLNSYLPGIEGFASHRSILGFSTKINSSELQISYINDYRQDSPEHEIRHILNLNVKI